MEALVRAVLGGRVRRCCNSRRRFAGAYHSWKTPLDDAVACSAAVARSGPKAEDLDAAEICKLLIAGDWPLAINGANFVGCGRE